MLEELGTRQGILKMSKVALITGTTSGIGQATAQKFVSEGWKVVGTGRREDRLGKMSEDLGSDKFLPLNFDIRETHHIDEMLNSIPEPFKEIDLLVNNAGLALGTAPAQSSKLEQWQQMIDTNINGLVSLTYKVLPRLIEKKGAIINIGSVAGTYPYPGGNVYGGTKAFVNQFSLGLRSDLHGTGVRVTCFEPGMTETEFTLVRTDGDKKASDKLYEKAKPLTGKDLADSIFWIATMPSHMNVNLIEIMTINQSFGPFQVYRDN